MQVHVGLCRNLWKVGDAEDLMLRGDALQATTERLTRSPPEPSINLIKDQCPPLTRVTERLLQREGDAAQLTTRSDLCDGCGGLTSIRREEILNLIPAAAINKARHTINKWIVGGRASALSAVFTAFFKLLAPALLVARNVSASAPIWPASSARSLVIAP
jgi:hypothetical protein